MQAILSIRRNILNFVGNLPKTMQKTNEKTRESNIELLRIASMMMVLVVHMDGAALGLPECTLSEMDARSLWRLAVEAAVIIGVNCFTLISGYFGIKLRVRSVLSYLFQCVFYAVGIATFACLYHPAKYSFNYWLESWMVLTHTDLWYVPAYFCLMLLSPVINSGMAALSRRQNLGVVSGFVLFNLWAGWWWGGRFNPTGYTVVQLVMVYMIGRLMSMYRRPDAGGITGWAMIYFTATAGVFFSATVMPVGKAFAYNSPLVLISSLAFFYIFLCMRFRSKVVNFMAKSAFAVYLVHKAPVIWGGMLKPFMLSEWMSLSLGGYSVLVAVMAIAIYLIVIVPDMIRRVISQFIIGFASKCIGKQ